MGEYDRANSEFAEAFSLAKSKDDFESMSLTHGQQAIGWLLKRQTENAKTEFKSCLAISQELKAGKMQLECLLCLAYICFDEKDWLQAQKYFDQAYNVS